MPTPLENDIREHLAQYLDNRLSLEAFEEWFAPVVWMIEEAQDPGAEALAYEIELRLAEHANGHRPDEDLRSHFAAAISRLHPTRP